MRMTRPDDAGAMRVAMTCERWRRDRAYLNAHRHALSLVAQQLYPEVWRVAGTTLLARPSWLPQDPVPLERVALSWQSDVPGWEVSGREPASALVRPLRAPGERYSSYAEALGDLSRPRLFEDRKSYRLLDVDVGDDAAILRFGQAAYFDIINICEAVAHELAAVVRVRPAAGAPPILGLPFRSLLGDPTDFARRPMIPAISTLVLRQDVRRGDGKMILHWRDPSRVASGGGLHQVTPVGVFQPSSDAEWNVQNDFDLWRSIVRELNEELLGGSEDYGSLDGPIDYESWSLYEQLADGRRRGVVRAYWLGLGVDPLTLVTDLLAVIVFESRTFDELFGRMATRNEEGVFLLSKDGAGASVGLPFTDEYVERFSAREHMQPAGAALLRLAWEHRNVLIG
jgi:hypothetical protein